MLANFLGVLLILTPPLCAKAFIMCSKSNPIVDIFIQTIHMLHMIKFKKHPACIIFQSITRAQWLAERFKW
jgi:hypothetical protein